MKKWTIKFKIWICFSDRSRIQTLIKVNWIPSTEFIVYLSKFPSLSWSARSHIFPSIDMGSLDPSITFRTLHKQIILFYWIDFNSCYFPCYFQCCFPPAPCLLFLMKTLRASISFYKNCKQVYVQENEEIRYRKKIKIVFHKN